MSSERRFSCWAWLVPLSLLASAAQGCADFSRGSRAADGTESTDAGESPDGGALSFAADIYPLLTICLNCQVPGGAASSSALIFAGHAATDYQAVLKFVQTAAPASSRLLSKIGGSGHGGGAIYAAGTPEYATILAWIQQGAPP